MPNHATWENAGAQARKAFRNADPCRKIVESKPKERDPVKRGLENKKGARRLPVSRSLVVRGYSAFFLTTFFTVFVVASPAAA